jgi:hypothetical protein
MVMGGLYAAAGSGTSKVVGALANKLLVKGSADSLAHAVASRVATGALNAAATTSVSHFISAIKDGVPFSQNLTEDILRSMVASATSSAVASQLGPRLQAAGDELARSKGGSKADRDATARALREARSARGEVERAARDVDTITERLAQGPSPAESKQLAAEYLKATTALRGAGGKLHDALARVDEAAARLPAEQAASIAGHTREWAAQLDTALDNLALASSTGAASRPGSVAQRLLPSTAQELIDRAHDPELVGPPGRKPVLHAKPGEKPLIGMDPDYFDPAASYEDNLAKLKKEGVPRFARLTREERAHESAFADQVQQHLEHTIQGAELLAKDPNSPTAIYEVDAMKRLYPEYGVGKRAASGAEQEVRLTSNHALHPTSEAVARLAFLKRLDEMARLPDGDARKQVFVTNGGCAAGKGSLTEIVKQHLGDVPFGAVWDAAGEGNALENAWVLKAARARGLKTVFGFANNDGQVQYRDVLARAEYSGRVVDVATFAESYTEGPKNFRKFLASPEYQAAQKAGAATSIGIHTGPFDTASLTDKTRAPYPQMRLLGDHGIIDADDVPPPPSYQDVAQSAAGLLQKYLQDNAAKPELVDLVRQGALENVRKF